MGVARGLGEREGMVTRRVEKGKRCLLMRKWLLWGWWKCSQFRSCRQFTVYTTLRTYSKPVNCMLLKAEFHGMWILSQLIRRTGNEQGLQFTKHLGSSAVFPGEKGAQVEKDGGKRARPIPPKNVFHNKGPGTKWDRSYNKRKYSMF